MWGINLIPPLGLIDYAMRVGIGALWLIVSFMCHAQLNASSASSLVLRIMAIFAMSFCMNSNFIVYFFFFFFHSKEISFLLKNPINLIALATVITCEKYLKHNIEFVH